VFFLTGQELFKGDVGMNLYEYDLGNRPGHKIIRVSAGDASALGAMCGVCSAGAKTARMCTSLLRGCLRGSKQLRG
jgi:hypothetical protein